MEGDHGEGEVVPKGPACSVRYVAARQAALPGGKGLTKTRTHILITKMCQWSSWAHRLKSAVACPYACRDLWLISPANNSISGYFLHPPSVPRCSTPA
eukprot:scaffold26066_cov15-Tisochrysis_lutea.AAC.1